MFLLLFVGYWYTAITCSFSVELVTGCSVRFSKIILENVKTKMWHLEEELRSVSQRCVRGHVDTHHLTHLESIWLGYKVSSGLLDNKSVSFTLDWQLSATLWCHTVVRGQILPLDENISSPTIPCTYKCFYICIYTAFLKNEHAPEPCFILHNTLFVWKVMPH